MKTSVYSVIAPQCRCSFQTNDIMNIFGTVVIIIIIFIIPHKNEDGKNSEKEVKRSLL